ncbi:hypothetical protein MNBD_GAMMA24-2540 [hydrothermal vent metagenome]|uniref:Uncharacterized protein n=1 Tax=hydrothermal vent metagenome TaxID=652676 RepID=A0A3B1C612_9ZZZZ
MGWINVRLIIFALLASLLVACTAVPVVNESNLKKAAEANAKLGLAYMQQGRNETALHKLLKAVKEDPQNADAHQYLAVLYGRLQRPKLAGQHFRKALEIMPDSSLSSRVAAVRNNYAVFLCEQKHYDEAKGYFAKVLKDPLYQLRDRLFENMARCEQNKGNLHQAEEFYNKALKLNPRSRKSLLGLAQITYDKGLYDQTQVYLNKFLKYNGTHNAESLWLALLVQRQRGNTKRVAEYAIRLKSKYPDAKETQLLKQLEMQDSR